MLSLGNHRRWWHALYEEFVPRPVRLCRGCTGAMGNAAKGNAKCKESVGRNSGGLPARNEPMGAAELIAGARGL